MNIVKRHCNKETDLPALEYPPQIQRSGDLSVARAIVAGGRPRLYVQWDASGWSDGVRLLGFRSTSGFSRVDRPDDLRNHGSLIIEARQDDWHVDELGEGTYYYTFLRHKPGLFGLWDLRSEPLRFCVTIPSIRARIERLKDERELEELPSLMKLAKRELKARMLDAKARVHLARKKIDEISTPALPAPQAQVKKSRLERERAAIDEMITAAYAQKAAGEAVQGDARFRQLDPDTQQRILRMIEQRLDLGEFGDLNREDS